MNSKELNFKETLILLFLFSSDMKYEFRELMQLLSINFDKTVELLNELSESGYIQKHKDLKLYFVTEKGKVYIYDKYLTDIDLNNTSEAPNKFDSYEEIKDRSSVLFIPKNFKNKLD
jgi:predicted transcriptional regulator